MILRSIFLGVLLAVSVSLWAQSSDVAPAVPDLTLPTEDDSSSAAAPAKSASSGKKKGSSGRKSTSKAGKNVSVPPVTQAAAQVNTEEISVENLPVPALAVPAAQEVSAENNPLLAAQDGFVPARETAPVQQQNLAPEQKKTPRVLFNPPTDRDPTLSPDDTLLLRHREEERLRSIEAEKQRKIDEENRRLAELERKRQLELELLRDPSREIRGKIRINGIIDKEVFIGNKVYTVGKTVLGARIVAVRPDSVVFLYKGQKFTKKVQLK